MSYSINHNHAKIEIVEVGISETHINITAMLYFEGNYCLRIVKNYSHANFSQSTAITDLKTAWNTVNAHKQYELAFRATPPPAAYIDTSDSEFP